MMEEVVVQAASGWFEFFGNGTVTRPTLSAGRA